jgi:hypothetical protein
VVPVQVRPPQQSAVAQLWPTSAQVGRVEGSMQPPLSQVSPAQQPPLPAPQASPAAPQLTSISHLPPTHFSEQHSLAAPHASPPNLHEKSSTHAPWSHDAGKQQSTELVQLDPAPLQKRPSRVSTWHWPPKHV